MFDVIKVIVTGLGDTCGVRLSFVEGVLNCVRRGGFVMLGAVLDTYPLLFLD